MYGHTVQMDAEFEEVEKRVREELERRGFGVMTEVDVKGTLEEKLDIDFPRYKILGTCNPENAYRALNSERELGLLLPCNVIVYEDEERVKASAIRAERMLSIVDNRELEDVARKVDTALGEALEAAKG